MNVERWDCHVHSAWDLRAFLCAGGLTYGVLCCPDSSVVSREFA